MLVTIVHLNGSYLDDVNVVGGVIVRTDPITHKMDVQFDTLQFRFKMSENRIVIRKRTTREHFLINASDFYTIQIDGDGSWG